MRISNANMSRMMVDNLNRNLSDYAKLNQQLSTKQRVNDISDDPIASIQMVLLENSKASTQQHQTNITRLQGNLKGQETSLTSVNEQLLSLQTQLQTAKSNNHSDSQSALLGNVINTLLEGIVDDINTKNPEGLYLYSGTKSDTKPVTWDSVANTYRYSGNNDSRSTVVGSGVTIEENTHLSRAFSTSSNDLAILTSLKKLADNMVNPAVKSSSYSDEISAMLGATEAVAKDISHFLTNIGAKENKLDHLTVINEDLDIVNAQLKESLVGIDLLQINSDLEKHFASTKISFSVHSKMSQLSIFNYI